MFLKESIKLRCPKCTSTQIRTRKDKSTVCGHCGYDSRENN